MSLDNEVVPAFSADGFNDPNSPYSPPAENNEENVQTERPEEMLRNAFEQNEEQQGRKKKRHKTTAEKRIAQLTYENGIRDQRNTFLEMQLAEQENVKAYQQQRIRDLENQVQEKEAYVGNSFLSNLDSEQQRIREGLKRAKEDGDVDLEVKLLEDMAEIKSKRNAYDVYQATKSQQEQYQEQNAPYVPYETSLPLPPVDMAPPVDIEFQEWLADNSWYETNPQLRNEADAIAQDLSNRLSFNKQSHLIGTQMFRDTVTRLMNDRYGLGDDRAPEQSYNEVEEEDYSSPYRGVESKLENNSPFGHSYPVSSTRSQHNVAPVSRKGGSMANDYLRNNQPQGKYQPLTKEEYSMARHLPTKGRETEADLVRRYQQAKNYPRSPLPGGTKDRLTIL